MSHNHLLAGLALIAALASPPALAQPASDPGAQRLIDQLCPPGVVCRGIRMPGADTGTPSPPPLQPGADAAAPQPPMAAMPPPMTVVPTARETTAPAGVAAVAITVNFSTGSATLTPQAAAALGSLGRALSSVELSPYRFRIEGHTDTVGDDRQNMALSQRRAEAVRAYLTKNFGLAPGRLMAVGLGESQPLIPTRDQTPEPSNRRVQVLNLGS